jgi:hypothetical protein
MKKIYTLLLLFAITLFYSIPTQAYTLDGNDIPLVQKKNLFDKDDPNNTYNRYVNSATGNLSTLATYYASDYITIQSNTTYTQSGLTGSYEQAFYDSDFVYISGNATTSFTTPSNAKYVRVSVIESILNSYQLELGSTATSYTSYGFLSLNDIFRDGNMFLNPSFTSLTNWTGAGGTDMVFDNRNTIRFLNTAHYRQQDFVVSTGDKIYASVNVYVNDNQSIALSQLFFGNPNYSNPVNTLTFIRYEWQYLSLLGTANTTSIRLLVGLFAGAITIERYFSNPYAINLTTLGINDLSKQILDHYYTIWDSNNAYIQGYDDGFEVGYDDGFDVGYDDGFDDGVASDTSYAVGYALGLSEGEDMETGSSLLILIVALIGFVMMIFGFTTKRGIFNLLSVGAFVVLGTLLVQFVGFVIIAIGLVLINIYYAFFGDL